MDHERALDFIRKQHRGVLATYRQDGLVQMSPVAVAVDEESRVVISTRETAMKTRNLRRNPRASVCALSERFFGAWYSVEGNVEILSLPEALEPLVDYYRKSLRRAPGLGRVSRGDGARAARPRAHHRRPKRTDPVGVAGGQLVKRRRRGSTSRE